jgi:hypothetical protein
VLKTDDVRVDKVSWINDRGSSGDASGTDIWSALVDLKAGYNNLTITATDEAGNQGSFKLQVIYAEDLVPPVIRITYPTTESTFTTSIPTWDIKGTATDDSSGVDKVTYEVARPGVPVTGGELTGSATNPWIIPNIQMDFGVTTIKVTAWDRSGNSSTATLAITLVPKQ